MSAVTEPRIQDPDVGSPDDHAHYAKKEDIWNAAVNGGEVTALCGVKFLPLRDPENYPTCQRCQQLLEQLDQRGMS